MRGDRCDSRFANAPGYFGWHHCIGFQVAHFRSLGTKLASSIVGYTCIGKYRYLEMYNTTTACIPTWSLPPPEPTRFSGLHRTGECVQRRSKKLAAEPSGSTATKPQSFWGLHI